MSRNWKPSKKTVELDPAARPSRIRREPVPANERADAEKQLRWRTSEREIWLAIVGIVLFAIAINVITIAISAYTN